MLNNSIERGNNREACFYGEEDYKTYATFLRESCAPSGNTQK